jgi:hypothetical protein
MEAPELPILPPGQVAFMYKRLPFYRCVVFRISTVNIGTNTPFIVVVLPSSTSLFTVVVKRFKFHLITLRHTTVGRIALEEGLARRRNPNLTTKTLYNTNIHAPVGILTHDPRKRSAADLRLRMRGYWDRPNTPFQWTLDRSTATLIRVS